MTDDTPEQTEERIKRMYPHLYARYTNNGKPPPVPGRKESRRKNVRNFFGAKKALILFALLFLTGCDDADSPDVINKRRYGEAVGRNDPHLNDLEYDHLPPQAVALSPVAVPVKAEADTPNSAPKVKVKLRYVKVDELVCPHCGKRIEIVEE